MRDARVLLLSLAQLLLLAPLATSCRPSGATVRTVDTNHVDNVPELYTFYDDDKQINISSSCPSSSVCAAVSVSLRALMAPEMLVAVRKPVNVDIRLKKVSEEGLAVVLADQKSRATATIVYKSDNISSSFVLKRGRLFGRVKHPSVGAVYIRPCVDNAVDNEDNLCHVVSVKQVDDSSKSKRRR